MTDNTNHAGIRLKDEVGQGSIVPLIGVYDVFSASIAARHFNGLFVSGFSFAASYYGLPDIVSFVQRLRTILPEHHIVVDIDDGCCDNEVACHVVRQLEALDVSGVVIEDQLRPRRCGHMNGKQIMDLEPFIEKLELVLAIRKDLFVVARTGAVDEKEALNRAHAFAKPGVDVKNCNQLLEKNQSGIPFQD